MGKESDVEKSRNDAMIGAQGGILIHTGAAATPPAGRSIFAIQSVGSTAELGVVVGNVSGLSAYTLAVGVTVYGSYSSVTAGAAVTDAFICYYR